MKWTEPFVRGLRQRLSIAQRMPRRARWQQRVSWQSVLFVIEVGSQRRRRRPDFRLQ